MISISKCFSFICHFSNSKAKGLELDVLFGNMENVITVAENFMNALATTVEEKSPEEQFIGNNIATVLII